MKPVYIANLLRSNTVQCMCLMYRGHTPILYIKITGMKKCPIYGGVQCTDNRGLKQLTVYRCLLVTEALLKDVLWIRLGSVSALLYPYSSGSFTLGIRYDKYVNILITIQDFVKKMN